MARQIGELALAAACILSIQTSFARDSGPAQIPAASPSEPVLKDAASVQAWRQYLQQLPPEEKEKLAQNLKRWQALSPAERELLRKRAAARREKLQEAAGAAIEQSGLALTPEQREAYVKRYLEGRGEIERPLRQEMQGKRKPLLDEMIKSLNEEFAALPPLSDGKTQDVAAKYSSLQASPPQAPQAFQLSEIDRAMKESGLTFDDDRRKFYTWRYIQLRRKIEQQLHSELETERKPQLDALAARLKSEFAPAPQTSGSAPTE